jgi:WD40 repeat protein
LNILLETYNQPDNPVKILVVNMARQFCHIFENLFNEYWLVPLLYEYYNPHIIVSSSRLYNPNHRDHVINVRNLETGELIYTCVGHVDYVYSVIVHNNQIISDSDSAICTWNRETGELIRTLALHVDWRLWILIDKIHNNIVILESLDNVIHIRDSNTGLTIHTLTHTNDVNSILVHNNKIISASDDRTIRVWDSTTGLIIHTCIGHTGSVLSIAVHDNQIISGSSDQTVCVWDLETGSILRTLTGHTDDVKIVCFVPGNTSERLTFGNTELIVSSDYQTIKVWNVKTGVMLHTFTRAGVNAYDEIEAVAVHGNKIISQTQNMFNVWDLETGALLRASDRFVQSVAVHDDKIIVNNYNVAYVQDFETGRTIYTLTDRIITQQGCTAW